MSIPITNGTGQSSVAAEEVGGLQYQRIEVLGQGGGSVLAVNPDGSFKASVIGTPTVFVAGSVATVFASTANQSVSGAITAPSGSVAQVRTDSASVITVPQISSIITILSAPSIVGTYAEDAAHATGDKGIFVMAVRNDLMPSITSADGDYSPFATGPVGEVLTANAPITKWIQGTADLRVVLGTSVQVLAAGGASVFTYVTAIQVANMGSASVLVTFAGGLGSILGYTIAPAGGGSNILYPNALKTGENSKFTASLSGTASVLVSAQGFTAKI